jgi:hypothetical protein
MMINNHNGKIEDKIIGVLINLDKKDKILLEIMIILIMKMLLLVAMILIIDNNLLINKGDNFMETKGTIIIIMEVDIQGEIIVVVVVLTIKIIGIIEIKKYHS